MNVDRLRTGRLVAIGLETTTGIPPQITEIAMMYVDRGVITAGPFDYRVQPDAPMAEIGPRARSHMRTASMWRDVAEQILLGVAGRIPVTHDAGRLRILHHHLPDWQPPEAVYTRQLAEIALPGLSSYDLERVSQAAGFDLLPRYGYGAVVEAQTVALLLPILLRRAPGAGRPGAGSGGARHAARQGRTHSREGEGC